MMLSQNIRLEQLTSSHQPAVAQLMERIYPPAYAHYWEDGGLWYLDHCYGAAGFQADLEGNDSAYYLVKFQAVDCGILLFREQSPCPDFPTQSALKLQKLYLGQEVQGIGLATQLMHFTEGRARELGHELVWLEVMASQPQALRFYEKIGYTLLRPYELSFDRLKPEMRGIQRAWKPL